MWASIGNAIFATELDSKHPFSQAKDGYGAFGALAGFAVAQSVALTAVAKDEDSTLVVSIYLIAVVGTIVWIWWMLRRLRDETLGTPPTIQTVRAFDRPSIHFGRWTLGWTCFVAVIMSLLWVKGLLPNQTTRVPFDRSGEERCDVNYAESVSARDYFQEMGGTPEDREPLCVWIEWLKASTQPAEKTVLVKQKTDLKKRYMSFTARIRCNEDKYSIMGKRVCCLVKPDQNSVRPIFRQLAFRQATPLGPILDTVDIPYADPGEWLFFIIRVTRNPILDDKKKPKLGDKGNPLLYDFPNNEEGLGIVVEWSR